MSEQKDKSFELDGTRPIESTDLEVAETFEEDGTRPIAESPDFLVREDKSDREAQKGSSAGTGDRASMNKTNAVASGGKEVVDTFEADGTRPITEGNLEVADTYQEDGKRPIGKGADYLVASAKQNQQDSKPKVNRQAADRANVGSGSREVVDTFEADGTRPVMSNKYDVVDTLEIDGDRPITAEPGQ